MKFLIGTIFCVGLFAALAISFSRMQSPPQSDKPLVVAPAGPDADLKSWTASDGRVIQARFIKVDGETVVIEKDHKTFAVPFAKLNPASVAQAQALSGASDGSKDSSKAAEAGPAVPGPKSEPFAISMVTPAESPKEVRLKSSEDFPASNGSGRVTVPAGARLDVVSRSGEILRVSYLGGSKDLHYSKTSFQTDVEATRKLAAQAALEAQAKEKLALAKAEKEERERKEAAESPQAKINAYWSVLKSDPFAMKLVKDVAVDHAKGGLWYVTVTVTNLWHIRNKQLRLQDAQNLWKLWAVLVAKEDPDKARMKLVDLNGNEVGGLSMIGEIWVQD